MKQGEIKDLQEQAQQAYERLHSPGEAHTALQNVLLAEIALQLATHNHWLEQIAQRLKNIDDNSIVMREKP